MGRNTLELLEAVEPALDAVSLLVSPEVASRCVLPVGLQRNDRSDPVHRQFFAQEIAVIAFVGKVQPWLADRQQVRNGV